MGDWVYLKLQPYVQSSLVLRANKKTNFQVLWSILGGAMHWQYRLQATTSRIHFYLSGVQRFTTQDCCVSVTTSGFTSLRIARSPSPHEDPLASCHNFRACRHATGAHLVVQPAMRPRHLGRQKHSSSVSRVPLLGDKHVFNRGRVSASMALWHKSVNRNMG